ncbi:hypothetical protein Aple_026860 [Acrocarpospora pleiomorpha]|uniref:Uncharacterized protein n=1 Tax=Acrocarpospora pleiomorpha TaxID=90975 RepID=A0A5M3XFH0_9ACTN|nr:hypothetical protein Aple_026860 [Acrocarpospora pleiomorpha]
MLVRWDPPDDFVVPGVTIDIFDRQHGLAHAAVSLKRMKHHSVPLPGEMLAELIKQLRPARETGVSLRNVPPYLGCRKTNPRRTLTMQVRFNHKRLRVTE